MLRSMLSAYTPQVLRCEDKIWGSDFAELRIQSRSGLRRRQEDDLALEMPLARRARYGDRAFSAAGPRIRNSLPDNVKCSSSLVDFKS